MMKILLKIFYWIMFVLASLCSAYLLIRLTDTKFSVLVFYSFIAIVGYYTQEKINKWISKKIYGIFKAEKVSLPKKIVQFRTFLFGVAITALWASIGVDLTTVLISGSNSISEINIPLYDLALFLMVLSLIPELIWLFNYGINDMISKRYDEK